MVEETGVVIPPKLWGAGSQGKTGPFLSFRCLLDVHAGATRYPVVVQLLGHVWVRSLNPFGLEAHLRIQLYKTTKGAIKYSDPHARSAQVCSAASRCCCSLYLSESFFSPPFLNSERQLCGRCIWKVSSNRPWNSRQLVILGELVYKYPKLSGSWVRDNSEVHALPNFPLSLWD